MGTIQSQCSEGRVRTLRVHLECRHFSRNAQIRYPEQKGSVSLGLHCSNSCNWMTCTPEWWRTCRQALVPPHRLVCSLPIPIGSCADLDWPCIYRADNSAAKSLPGARTDLGVAQKSCTMNVIGARKSSSDCAASRVTSGPP